MKGKTSSTSSSSDDSMPGLIRCESCSSDDCRKKCKLSQEAVCGDDQESLSTVTISDTEYYNQSIDDDLWSDAGSVKVYDQAPTAVEAERNDSNSDLDEPAATQAPSTSAQPDLQQVDGALQIKQEPMSPAQPSANVQYDSDDVQIIAYQPPPNALNADHDDDTDDSTCLPDLPHDSTDDSSLPDISNRLFQNQLADPYVLDVYDRQMFSKSYNFRSTIVVTKRGSMKVL